MWFLKYLEEKNILFNLPFILSFTTWEIGYLIGRPGIWLNDKLIKLGNEDINL